MATNTRAVAQEVYERAVELYKKKRANDCSKHQWISGTTDLEDVKTALKAAQDQYANHPRSRVRKALASFSSKFMYYSSMGDVFAAQCPEYTSLAWGTMKLLFVVSYVVASV